MDIISELKTCPVCKDIKIIDEFRRLSSSGKNKVRKICNHCKIKFTEEQINNMVNQPYGGKLAPLPNGNVVITYAYKEGSEEISFEIAKQMVIECAATVVDQSHILKKFHRYGLTKHVLKRENYLCYKCNKEAQSIERIIPLQDGGLKSPLNSRAVCIECKRIDPQPQKKENHNLGSILYTYNNNHYEYKYIKKDFVEEISLNPSFTHIFCDASEHKNGGLFGIAIIIVSNQSVTIKTDTFQFLKGHSMYAELKAINFAIDSEFSDCKIIYTDINFRQCNYSMKNSKEKRLCRYITSKINIKNIIEMNDDIKRSIYYNLAHRYSRLAVNKVKLKLS
ncbi:hypothetical protein [Chengkuizengella sediminis]|uniref:hypothetical protein n=1 Tax=Chengkuizengella sediminis TaxID=1885917 RepID=UPI0013898AF8|nr:hypothetical protein [Chengkuizengella sediminis]NDI35729.1 hypothetical protein [Chengkuizengella sediminis]